jgi:hypothetical protein
MKFKRPFPPPAGGLDHGMGHFRPFSMAANSTVLEQPFLYVQWSQTITLFPVIQTCKFIAPQSLFPLMQHMRYSPALTRLVQDHGNALANLR